MLCLSLPFRFLPHLLWYFDDYLFHKRLKLNVANGLRSLDEDLYKKKFLWSTLILLSFPSHLYKIRVFFCNCTHAPVDAEVTIRATSRRVEKEMCIACPSIFEVKVFIVKYMFNLLLLIFGRNGQPDDFHYFHLMQYIVSFQHLILKFESKIKQKSAIFS